MDSIIRVEHLSKQYLLRKEQQARYNSMRDMLADRVSSMFKGGNKHSKHELFKALNDLSFEIRQGESVGIVGRNGAGKSTLLKILSRIVAPTSGRIEIEGRVASLLEVGTGFHPELSGRENIYLNGSILGMSRAEITRKFDEIVAFAEVERFLDTPVKRYSSGMYVRLAFAVAAHLEPEILIVDEVLAVGDTAFQKKCLGKMKDVTGEGRTVLFVSHNMGAVNSLCNRCIVLARGEKVFDGSATEGVNHYLKMNTTQSGLTLEQRIDRTGNQEFKFTDIRFRNAAGDLVQEVLSGDPLDIELDYSSKDGLDLSKLVLSVAFTDDFQNIVLAFVSDEMGVEFKNKSERTLRLHIPKVLMRGYLYNIRLFASYHGTGPESICDMIENAAQIQVISSDFWHSGKTIREGNYPVIQGNYIQ